MSILIKIADLDLSGKTVLIREDYNVPMKNNEITDDIRIKATLPTLRQILEAGAKIIIVSHLGRPDEGKYDEAFSLAPVAKSLSNHLSMDVPLIKDWVNGIGMSDYKIVLCENVRFEKGEIGNDDELSRKMAQLCQIYINDAFATAHRSQASTHGVAKYAPVSAAGPLLISELKALTKALRKPTKPIVAIIGGAKISTKLTILEALYEKIDKLILGGGIVNTFLKAAGYEIGKSLYEPDLVEIAEKLIKQAEKYNCDIPLPIDVVTGESFDEETIAETKSINEVEKNDVIMDVGPKTTKQLNKIITKAKTIVWNGPLGVFEFEQFSQGTKNIAQAIAASDAYSIAGGGDTIAAIYKFKVEKNISYISTGGGAFLEFLEGKKLPAIEILEEAARAWSAMEKAREL
jgi:phosphoglycerate kinase